MVFGLFGKNNGADLMIVNGHIFTQDPDVPWANAVAIKAGKILAVGQEDEMSSYITASTEILDLNDHYMIPGLIEAYGSPVLDVFRECCVFLDETLSVEEIQKIISEEIKKDPGEETFFAYGYSSDLLREINSEKATAWLDDIGADRPILLLSKDGYGAWINTLGLNMVQDAADEEGMDILTLPFTLSVLNPFPYEKLQEAVIHQSWQNAASGFTCLYNSGSPDFFDNIYQNILVAMHQEGLLPQRHYGALSVPLGLNPDFVVHKLVQNRTKCIELEELINFNTLKLYLNQKPTASLDGNALRELCVGALERGFDIEIQVVGKELLLDCFKVLSSIKIGVNQKSCITVAHDEMLSDEERQGLSEQGYILEIPVNPAQTTSSQQFIETRTLGGAEKLALLDKLGTIEPDKYADFAVFAENPLEGSIIPAAVMTILQGMIVFDKEEDLPEQWNQRVLQQNMDTDEFDELEVD